MRRKRDALERYPTWRDIRSFSSKRQGFVSSISIGVLSLNNVYALNSWSLFTRIRFYITWQSILYGTFRVNYICHSYSQGSNFVRKSTVHFLFDQEYTKFEEKISLCQGYFFSLSNSSCPSFVPPIFILLKKKRNKQII